MQSPLMQWCGLKSRYGAAPGRCTPVTTDAVVWIEILKLSLDRHILLVTTDAVVWIEMSVPTLTGASVRSPLMQWCGLKFKKWHKNRGRHRHH